MRGHGGGGGATSERFSGGSRGVSAKVSNKSIRMVATDEQLQQLVIDNFKTINRKVKQEVLPPEIGYTCENLRYDEELGAIYKRPPRRKYNSTSLGTDPIRSAYRYYKNSNSTMHFIISKSTLLQKGTDAAGTFADIKTGLTSGLRFKFLTFKDLCYAVNGTDNNQVYDGTNNCVDMGVPVPTVPTLAQGSATGLTGTYKYKVTYLIDSYQEGTASSASDPITVIDKKITVTIPTSSNTRVTHRKIYRTTNGGSVYYLLTTVSDNTTTSYTDSTADGSLGTDTAPTDYGVPGSYKYITLHKSRVFLAYNSALKSTIIYSDIRSGVAYPDVFPVNNALHIAKDDGDVITGIFEDHLGNLVVSKENSIRIIHTDTDSPVGWTIGDPLTSLGCIAPYSIVKTPYGVVYLTRYGENRYRLMLWTGSGVRNILQEIDPILDNIDVANLREVVSHFHNGKLYISYTDSVDFGAEAIDTETKLLLHCDGSDGTTSFADSSLGTKIVTTNGDAQIDTAQSKFGGASGLFDGTEDYLSLADSDDWNFGTGDLTIDLWVYFNSIVGNRVPLVQQYQDATHWWSFDLAPGAGIAEILQNNAGSVDIDADWSWTPSLNTWYHIAVVRASGVWKLFINGTSQTIGTNVNATFQDITENLIIGKETLNSNYLNGYIDELRISKGVARWTANFTPPTIAYGYGYNNNVIIIDMATLSYINIDKKNIDCFSSWNAGTDTGQLYTGSSDTAGFVYEEEMEITALASETAIAITWKGGKFTFGVPRLRKRVYQVKIEFDRTTASGTLSYFYSLDGATETQVDIALATYASAGEYIYQFPLATYCKTLQHRLYHADDIYALGIKRITYLYSIEPLYPII